MARPARSLGRPLLYPPPSAPLPNSIQFPLRVSSRLYTVIALLPLVFVYLVLAFTFYTYFVSLCVKHLLIRRHDWLRGGTELIVFTWLWFGCAGSVGMAYWRGGGIVNGVKKMRGREDGEDSEETIGLFSVRTGGGDAGGELGAPTSDDFGDSYEDFAEPLTPGSEIGLEESRGLLISPGSRLNRKMSSTKLEARSPRVKNPRTGGWDLGGALRELEMEVPSSADMRRRLDGKVMVKRNGGVRFCRKCIVEKADRAHHCSNCNACVLKMDHHCPWLGGGCVGWANYKFFLLFLWYGGVLGFYVAATLLMELMWFVDEAPENFELTPIAWALDMMLGVVFGFALSGFGIYHFYLAISNRTTLEAMESTPTFLLPPLPDSLSEFSSLPPLTTWEKRKLERNAKKINVYDVGAKGNLKQIFGGWDKKWTWGLPWGWPPGDGTTFPLNSDNLIKLSEISARLWASAEAEERERDRYRGGRFGLTTDEESGSAGDTGSSESGSERTLRS